MRHDGDLSALTEIEPTSRWYVVRSQPHKELYSARNLRNQGFLPFVPRVTKTVRHARRMTPRLVPLFPRYLFVSLDILHDRWRSVSGTFGVSHLVMNGDRPAPTPPGVVENLIASADNRDVVDFRPELSPGESVRLLTGPFAEMIGRLEHLDGEGRIAVLLEIMGSKRTVTVPVDGVMPTGS